MHEHLTEENFLIFCAKHYDNPHCQSTEEFLEDLNHIKYIKKLLTRYAAGGELKERLILNHIIILCNLFGPEIACRVLFLKLGEQQFALVKPFLVLLNILPSRIYNVDKHSVIDTDMIPMDENIIAALRVIKNG